MPNDDAPSGDTRDQKLPVPWRPAAPTVETGRLTTLVVAPPYYWGVRNEDPSVWRRKQNMVWAVDPGTKRPLSEAAQIDLKRGDTNATVPFDWVSDLQRDLWDFGYKAVLADTHSGALSATPPHRDASQAGRLVQHAQGHPCRPLVGGGPGLDVDPADDHL